MDGHGLFGNVRVYEWLDMTPIPVGDLDVEELVAACSPAACTCTLRRRIGRLTPGTARR